jgi:DNA helicase-2/ATP-dependent DNA helicase PcrA
MLYTPSMSQHDLFPVPPPTPAAPVPPAPSSHLDRLNPAQRQAVEAIDGPVLVLAGAGTGKTRVLTTRLAHILVLRRAFPSQILAVTFTNKAAREMKERLEAMIGGRAADGLWLGTFHSIAARILRRHAELLGLQPNFTILDADDQLRLLKQLTQAEGIDDRRWPARALAGIIQRWKDRGLPPEKVPLEDAGDVAGGRILALYRAYQERLATLNAVDFGDLTLHNLTLFTNHREVLEEYQRRFRFILVDEYQDTNVAQYLWLRLLAQASRNLCCVGDDDQCLAAGTLVTMGDGTRRPIEQLKIGDEVLSCYGSGDFRPARVARTYRGRGGAEGIAITTCGGRNLVSTPEHVHFAGYRLGLVPQTYFTYLMHKREIGYRLGTTQVYTKGQRKPMVGLAQRLLQEHADALWVIGTHESENEARAEEYILSLRYQLPTLPFVPRKGGSRNGLVHDPVYLARVFGAFDTQTHARRLLVDRGLSIDHPHHRPRSRNANRRDVVVTLCGDRRGRSPMHRISIVGNDKEGRAALEELGLSVRAAKAGSTSWRFETACADFGSLADTVETIRRAFEINLFRVARFGRNEETLISGNSLPFISATAVRPGMAMFDGEGGYDIVERVERVALDGIAFDIDVERTHNFVAGGLVTHNSVYSWRGAEIGNILRFEKDFPGAQVIRLEQNYRSTAPILAAAGALIAHNEGRLGKTLWTELNEGEKLTLRGVWDADEEARWVGEEIEAQQRKGQALAEIAILVRAGFQTREFEERFITLGLPYRVVGGPRFYERQEIRDALAYLRLIHQPADDLAFERIVNLPRRGIGDATLQTVHRLARDERLPLTQAAERLVSGDALKPAARKALAGFLADLARWRGLAIAHPLLAQIVLDESGYTAMWQADKSADAPGRLENLKELVAAMAEFENLAGFLEHVSLVMEATAEGGADMVNLMTLHSAKGLEFESVFLPGWEEGLFPSQRSMDENGIKGLEEERRLAYVGITRAKRRAAISYAANRRIHGQWQPAIPSRFIGELPADQLEILAEPGLSPRTDRFVSGADWLSGQRPDATRRDVWGSEWRGDAQGRAAGLRRAPPLIEGRSLGPREGVELKRVGGFRPGDRVFHQKFGYGTVQAVEDNKLSIDFEKAGEKKVMDAFVEKA